jgi:PAS domain S-box-containing protein
MKAVGGGNGDDPRSGGPADIAARLAHAEARAREVEERYTLATSAALEGIYEWIVDAGRLVLSERAKQFFAFAGEGLTPAAWNERIHPDDFAGYRAVIAAHFRGDTAHLEHEYRIRDAEGGYRWILDRGVGVRGAGGRVTRVVGALSDINDRKLAEIELEAARDRAEAALRQQSAVSEILRLMSGSPNDAQPVFDLVARRAGNLCGAEVAIVSRYEAGRRIELAAIHGVIPQAVSVIRGLYPMDVAAESLTARAVRSGEVVHVADVLADAGYGLKAFARAAQFRGGLGVPIMRDRRVLGTIFVGRAAPGLFDDSEVVLVKAFADQAAIAIENARLFREIDEKNRQLEVASRHKSEFLASMSHELRTPLNAIIGFSEVLSERLFGDVNDKQAEYLDDIQQSGRHLLSLINDILDLSKIEAGRMELERSEFELARAIEQTLLLVRERAERRGIALRVALDGNLGTIVADERKVKQVLLNLLSNALKFTPQGGTIDVRARVRDADAEISVADSGVGIAPEDQDAVFEEFRQVGSAETKAEGTGLGLAISKRIVELHGGRIFLVSAPRVGSTFTFRLPLSRGAEPPGRPA